MLNSCLENGGGPCYIAALQASDAEALLLQMTRQGLTSEQALRSKLNSNREVLETHGFLVSVDFGESRSMQ